MKNVIVANNKDKLQSHEEVLQGTCRTIKGNLALRSQCIYDYHQALKYHEYKLAKNLNNERIHADKVMGIN